MEIRNRLEYILFRGLVTLLRTAGPEASARLLSGLGFRVGRVAGYRRMVVLRQLGLVFPEATGSELDRMADGVYRHLGRTVGEVFGQRPGQDLPPVTVEPGWEPLEAALARGRGVIVATGHIGNFELGGAVLARRYPLLDVVKPQRNPLFDDFLKDLRAERGILTVPMDRSGPAVLRHLRRGGVVSLLLDQDAGADGLAVEFLGQPAATWPGAARLSLRTGCPVVPMALLRQDSRGHRLCIGQPILPDRWSSSPDGVRDYLQHISLAVERYIRAEPEQWFWVHRRWKSRQPKP